MQSESILITGTTSGLGRALLEHYVKRGAQVVAVNRRPVQELESRYPSVRFELVDVRSAEQVRTLIASLVESGELPHTFFLNAGVNAVDNDDAFQLAAYQAVVETNLFGVVNFVEPLVRLPAGPVERHLVAIGSLASYVANPYGLGYHTSKKALSASFDVWSRMYAGTDLVFQEVVLGPVRTGIYTMEDQFPPWMVRTKYLFSGSLEGAARAVSRFARSSRRKLFYPRRAVPLYLGMWLGQSLVPGFFQGRKTLGGQPRRAKASRSPKDTE